MVDKPEHVYHGTRCPRELLLERGVVFDREFLFEKVEQFALKLGVDLEIWGSHESYYAYTGSGRRLYNILIEGGKRAQVHVTDKFLNAVSYSKRNPEFLEDYINNIPELPELTHYELKHPPRELVDTYLEKKKEKEG